MAHIVVDFIYLVAYVINFILCLIGNLTVIYVLCIKLKLAKKSYYCILSIAICDLLPGFVGLGIFVYGVLLINLGHSYISTILTAYLAWSILTILLQLSLSVDRYFAISHYYEYQLCDNKRIIVPLLLIWMLGLFVGVIIFMNIKSFDRNDSLIILNSTFAIPSLIIIVILNRRIFKEVKELVKKIIQNL
jgi:hypothetical protein